MNHRIPMFFKIWFAICATLAFAIMFSTIYVILHPEMIGNYAGQIVHGYQESAQ